MLLARYITTFILALLLANPACCCAFAGNGTPDEAPTHSCCAGGSNSETDEDAPSDRHNCSCSINKQYTEHGEAKFSSPDFPILPAPVVVFVDVDPIQSVFIVDKPQAKRPPPGPALRVLYSVFRL